jgi:transcriptional regulator with XRE-family HTH domain
VTTTHAITLVAGEGRITLDNDARFGAHVRAVRLAHGIPSAALLARRSGLDPSAVRKLERGDYSPSLETISKLCAGLGISLSGLFADFDGAPDEARDLADLIASKGPQALAQATRVLLALFDEPAIAGEETAPHIATTS